MQDVYKPYIKICLQHKLEKGCGKGCVWVYVLAMGMEEGGCGEGVFSRGLEYNKR